jgi:hypothetical protein
VVQNVGWRRSPPKIAPSAQALTSGIRFIPAEPSAKAGLIQTIPAKSNFQPQARDRQESFRSRNQTERVWATPGSRHASADPGNNHACTCNSNCGHRNSLGQRRGPRDRWPNRTYSRSADPAEKAAESVPSVPSLPNIQCSIRDGSRRPSGRPLMRDISES